MKIVCAAVATLQTGTDNSSFVIRLDSNSLKETVERVVQLRFETKMLSCLVLGWWWAACPACPRGALYK